MSRQLERDIAVYEANLKGLNLLGQEGGLDGDEIISMFTYRDAIEEGFDREGVHILEVFRVIELDELLRQYAGRVVERVNLAACRQQVHPPQSHWWWFLDEWLAGRSQVVYQPQKAWQHVAEGPDLDALVE